MESFKKFLILAVLVLVPALAIAKIGTRNLDGEVKARNFCVQMTTADNQAKGRANNISVLSINGISTPTSTAASTGAPATFMWPNRLSVTFQDASNDGTLTCSTVTILGTDQAGDEIREVITNLTESGTFTANVFATVSSVSATGCSGGSTGDNLYVRSSFKLGLGVKLGSKTDVEAVCIPSEGGLGDTACATYNDGTANDIESAVDLATSSLDLTALEIGLAGGSNEVVDLEHVCVRVRSSNRGPGF